MKPERGVSLIELLVALMIFGILAAIATPSFLQMRQNALFRQEATQIGNMLREARGRTVSLNREHQAQIDVTAALPRYQLAQGNRSSGSTVWAAVNGGWINASTGVTLTQTGCTGGGPIFTVDFNPNGSASAACTVEIRDTTNTIRYRVAVTQNTGRIRIQ